MRIVVFGANGPTGRQLIDQAVASGHRVTAVTRRPDTIPAGNGVAVCRANVVDADDVDRVIVGHDAVLSALGAPYSRKPITLYSQGISNIMAAMQRHGVRKLVAVSGMFTDPTWRPSGAVFFNRIMGPILQSVGRTLYADMSRMESLIRTSDLEWSIARPAGLFDHPTVTSYEIAEDTADGLVTARADLAASMLAQLGDDRYVRKAIGVITTDVKPSVVQRMQLRSWIESLKWKTPSGSLRL